MAPDQEANSDNVGKCFRFSNFPKVKLAATAELAGKEN